MRDATILIVDDDEELREAVQRRLQGERYTITTAATGEEALAVFSGGERPDLVLLDIMLPDIEGTSVCQQIRQTSSVPIIMLTARTEEADRILGLELGADDYVTKPFSLRELVARIKAVLRRVEVQAQPASPRAAVLDMAGVTLDLNSREVTVDGEEIELTPTQMRLLQVLMQQPGRVFSTDELLATVWEYRQYDPHLVETHISNLRTRIEKDPKNPERIITVRSFGYKFATE